MAVRSLVLNKEAKGLNSSGVPKKAAEDDFVLPFCFKKVNKRGLPEEIYVVTNSDYESAVLKAENAKEFVKKNFNYNKLSKDAFEFLKTI